MRCRRRSLTVDLDPVRLLSLERLVEEEAALEEEQRARDKIADKRSGGRTRAARAERVRRVRRLTPIRPG